MIDYGKAPIKMEGGIANPDDFTWQCNCEECKAQHQKWKEEFDKQQEQLRNQT
jgi:hypothetical protein